MEDFKFAILRRYYLNTTSFSVEQFQNEVKTHQEFVQFNINEMPGIVAAFVERGFVEVAPDDKDGNRNQLKISKVGKVAFEFEKDIRDEKERVGSLQDALNTSVITTNKWMRIFTGIVAIAAGLTLIVQIISVCIQIQLFHKKADLQPIQITTPIQPILLRDTSFSLKDKVPLSASKKKR